MTRLIRWTFLPLIAASAAWSSAQAAEVRDHAGMFSPKAVQTAQAELTRVERLTRIPIVIETIDAIPGLAAGASHDEKMRAVNNLAEKRDRDIQDEGVYILISKKDKVLSNVLVRARYADVLTRDKRRAIGSAFLTQFKAGDFDGGLAKATEALVSALPDGPVAVRGRRAADAGPGVPVRARRPQQHGIGSLLTIGLGILAVLFVVRLLGGLLGGRGAGGYPHQMGGMKGPGMGPGFGGPGYGGGYGYGGRGGGFFSSLMGGIGGAMAGNWLYDQFSGRSHGHTDASNYNADYGYGNDPGGDAIIGGDDGGGGSWGDSGSGGGDWGGGGGDWGGGGGDWGGGDGGDW